MSRRQTGFTLIELVMVIVILGVLAAFALPKFADLAGNARAAVFSGAVGAARSAIDIVHAQSLIENETTLVSGQVSLEGTAIDTRYGYPTRASLGDAAQFSGTEIAFTANASPTTSTIAVGTCLATYTQASTSTSPATLVVTTPPASGEC